MARYRIVLNAAVELLALMRSVVRFLEDACNALAWLDERPSAAR